MIILSNSQEWIFYAKGNANILFKYQGENLSLQGKLLRLRQSNQQQDTTQVYKHYCTLPMILSAYKISIQLVRVSFRKENCLKNDEFGLLMSNLTFNSSLIKKEKYYSIFQKYGNNSWILELKPKWLVGYFNGCRNCTMHKKKYKEEGEPFFCSLDLINNDSISRCCQNLLDDSSFYIPLIKYLQSNDSLLKKLQTLQNPIDYDRDRIEDICFQMMLRDISIFIIINKGNIESVKITDLDPKSGDKLEEWKVKELKLRKSLVVHTLI